MSKNKGNGKDTQHEEQHVPEQLLDLSTLTEHDWITIDGKKYEIKNRDEFSITELHRLTQWGKAAQKLGDEKELTEEDVQSLSDRTHDLIHILFVGGLPEELDKKLSDMQRFRIIEVFTKRSGLLKEQENSSQPSSDSTEATPSAG